MSPPGTKAPPPAAAPAGGDDRDPLVPRALIDEDLSDADFADQIALSSYGLGASDFFVCSAYSRIPSHARPVFSGRVFLFLWSALVLKPLCCVALYLYYRATGRAAPVATAACAAGACYLVLAARGLMLYANIKRDRLPLSPLAYWLFALVLGAAAVAATAVAATETFGGEGLFAYVRAARAAPRADPARSHAVRLALGALAAAWVAAADSAAAAANFFLARFWVRAILNARVVF
ncbi:envelope protein UL20 [Ateline alphaherpesvirus 1]|uniref:Envelope protein UL20 n=1 Tax=Herpesvirus ateles type 1 (strain Lennette) TaxID=35243 RepID=A0A1S6JLP7_HSVA1|nr:envelope protein UL20 [Ateline alphaherpesvirus 1]AQS79196.1 envelope protein UL20 [Ateline alphaherpesvirus 1]